MILPRIENDILSKPRKYVNSREQEKVTCFGNPASLDKLSHIQSLFRIIQEKKIADQKLGFVQYE